MRNSNQQLKFEKRILVEKRRSTSAILRCRRLVIEPLEDRRLLTGDVLQLSSLDGSNGFRLDGVAAGDYSGRSVSSAGDVNGDGFDDLIVSADGANPNGSQSGSSYVVFGKSGRFAATLNLSTLNGTTGFRLDGVAGGDQSGVSVSSAGDVNGDGFDDLIVGAYAADPNGGSSSGSSYVVFGGNFTGGIETQLGGDGDNVLVANQGPNSIDILIGGRGNDTLISDGGSDILLGGEGNDVLAMVDANFSGTRRLIGGTGTDAIRLDGSGLTLDLPTIADNRIVDIEEIDLGSGLTNEIVLTVRELLNLSSHSNTLTVRGTGSWVRLLEGDWSAPVLVNLAGTDFFQFIRGAATLNVQTTLSTRFAVVGLSTLNGTNGFRLDGASAYDFAGGSVSSAGDVNGDSFDDLIIGASGVNNDRGSSYVVFGKPGGFAAAANLSTLDGTNGFRLNGAAEVDLSGGSVSSAGDVNGDGYDDLIVGASFADPNSINYSGSSYVVFGKSGGFAATISLSSLDGVTGFRLDGVAAHDRSGRTVSSAGDVNGDVSMI